MPTVHRIFRGHLVLSSRGGCLFGKLTHPREELVEDRSQPGKLKNWKPKLIIVITCGISRDETFTSRDSYLMSKI